MVFIDRHHCPELARKKRGHIERYAPGHLYPIHQIWKISSLAAYPMSSAPQSRPRSTYSSSDKIPRQS